MAELAAAALAEFFRERPTELFYERQLCVLLERSCFH
jgi:hypothetical protein